MLRGEKCSIEVSRQRYAPSYAWTSKMSLETWKTPIEGIDFIGTIPHPCHRGQGFPSYVCIHLEIFHSSRCLACLLQDLSQPPSSMFNAAMGSVDSKSAYLCLLNAFNVFPVSVLRNSMRHTRDIQVAWPKSNAFMQAETQIEGADVTSRKKSQNTHGVATRWSIVCGSCKGRCGRVVVITAA